MKRLPWVVSSNDCGSLHPDLVKPIYSCEEEEEFVHWLTQHVGHFWRWLFQFQFSRQREGNAVDERNQHVNGEYTCDKCTRLVEYWERFSIYCTVCKVKIPRCGMIPDVWTLWRTTTYNYTYSIQIINHRRDSQAVRQILTKNFSPTRELVGPFTF